MEQNIYTQTTKNKEFPYGSKNAITAIKRNRTFIKPYRTLKNGYTRRFHQFKYKPFFKTNVCTKCNKKTCKICNYVKITNSLNINNYIFPIMSDTNCLAKGIIYIIGCKRCNTYYIGESERTAEKRLSEHLRNILKFKNDIYKTLVHYDSQSEVAIHFNCSFHILNLSFAILQF